MLIFANPLGAPQFDHAASLITRAHVAADDRNMQMMYQIGRTTPDAQSQPMVFSVYRARADVPRGWEPEHLLDPFPKPIRRATTTQSRGRFVLPIRSGEDEIAQAGSDVWGCAWGNILRQKCVHI
jgi:hypothetical protein